MMLDVAVAFGIGLTFSMCPVQDIAPRCVNASRATRLQRTLQQEAG